MKESENENEGDDELVTPKTLVFLKPSSSSESPLQKDVKEFLIKFEDFKTLSWWLEVKKWETKSKVKFYEKQKCLT